MKFGVCLPVSHQGVYLPTPFASPDDLIRAAQLAERLGFYSAWGLDFVTSWHEPVLPRSEWPEWHEVMMTLSFLASQTTKIKLGTASIQLPLRDPFMLAKQAGTLDVLSKGRVILGVGLGVYRLEYLRLHPRNRKVHRGTLFDEYLEAMHRFFTEDAVSFDGKYYACDQVCLIPKPVQNPFPIYISGTTDETFKRIAKWSTGWLLSRLQAHEVGRQLELLVPYLESAGRNRKEIDLVVTNGLSLGRTREEATTRFKNSMFVRRMDVVAEILDPGSTNVQISSKPSEDKTKNLVGTVDDVIEQVAAIEAKGIDHIVLYYFAVDNVQEMCDQIQWFGESVLPKFSS
jgi:probable F420-dependent oxidoreductase